MNMKNDNTFYSCPYCKEEYTEPSDLAHCILSCEARIKAEEEEKREAKLVAEKAARKKEIESAEENYRRLLGAYIKDYGSYSATRSCMSDDDIFTHLYRIFR